jgi:hypothetical protein
MYRTLVYYLLEKLTMARDKESIAEELKFMFYTWLATRSDNSDERELYEGRYQGASLMAEWTGMFTTEEIKQLEKNVVEQFEKTREEESV